MTRSTTEATSAHRGRPRSRQATEAILSATHELTIEAGLGALSIDAVAARAGCSKATIYRWWPDKRALALDALLHRGRETITFADTGDLLADLAGELRRVVDFYTATPTGAALLEILGQATSDPELAQEVRARIIGPACDAARGRLAHGQTIGQLREDVDLDLVINVVWGPVYHRLLVTGEPVTAKLVDDLFDFLAPALASSRPRAPA